MIARGRGLIPWALALNLCACVASREPEAIETRASALGEPTVGPELELDMPVATPANASMVRIAAGATSHLVIWSAENILYGVRVGFDGTVLDQLPILIQGGAGMGRVAWNGTDWLVVWVDTFTVHATRVAADGTVRGEITVAEGFDFTMAGGVASDGSGFLVSWYSSQEGLMAAAVTASGTVGPVFRVSEHKSPFASVGSSSVAFNGTTYLFAFSEVVGGRWNCRAWRLTPAGAAVGSIIELGRGISPVDVASDGTGWLVSYLSNDSAAALRWQAVTADGTLGGSGSVAGRFALEEYVATSQLSSAWDGSAYTLAAIRGAQLFAARVSGAGALLTSKDVLIAGDFSEIAFASGGATLFAAYGPPLLGSRLDTTLTALDSPPVALSFRANQQYGPRAAFSGRDYLVVWGDGRGIAQGAVPDSALFGRRIAADGQRLGSSAFRISPSGISSYWAVASNGQDYLVVWQSSGHEIRGARVTAAGSVLDVAGIPIAAGVGDESAPSVVSNGADYYVVWGVDGAIRGVRVLANGSVPGAPVTISDTVGLGWAIGFNGTHYLVAWGQAGIQGARVNPVNGAVLDTARIALADQPVGLAIASDGTDWLVVWEDEGVHEIWEAGLYQIRGARVGPDGVVKDPSGVTIFATSGSSVLFGPSVAWTGNSYWVDWWRAKSPGSLDPGPDGRLGKRVSSLGAVLDADSILITDDTSFSDFYVAGGQDRALVTYSRPEYQRYGVARAFGRLVAVPGGGAGAGGAGGVGAGGASGAGTGGAATGGAGSGGRAGTGGAGSGGRGGANGAAGSSAGAAAGTAGSGVGGTTSGAGGTAGSGGSGGAGQAGAGGGGGGTGQGGRDGGSQDGGTPGDASSGGGQSGSGGAVGAAGSSGGGASGGTAGGVAGRGGTTGGSGGVSPGASGCGCAVQADTPASRGSLSAVILFGLCLLRRRRSNSGAFEFRWRRSQ